MIHRIKYTYFCVFLAFALLATNNRNTDRVEILKMKNDTIQATKMPQGYYSEITIRKQGQRFKRRFYLDGRVIDIQL